MSIKDSERIIELIKKGDASMLEVIYKENRLPFLFFAKKFKLPHEDNVDVYQDAIIALRDNIVNGNLKEIKSSIKTYLFSIGKNMIFQKIKKSKKIVDIPVDLVPIDDVSTEFVIYEEDKSHKQRLVNSSFEKLGKKCQEVLKLFYYEGLTLEEIQHYFNYDNYNVVKSQKSRCLKTLKDLINNKQYNG